MYAMQEQRAAPVALQHTRSEGAGSQEVLRQVLRRFHRSYFHQVTTVIPSLSKAGRGDFCQVTHYSIPVQNRGGGISIR